MVEELRASRQQSADSTQKQMAFAGQQPARSVCCVLCAVCLMLVFTTGCIQRSLTIRTNPPGASVYLNDQLKGVTPLTYNFTWYGSYRVTIQKEGYEQLDDRQLLRAPKKFWIPFDLVMELWPFPVRDERTWSYTLTPATEPAGPVPPGAGSRTPARTTMAEAEEDRDVHGDTDDAR